MATYDFAAITAAQALNLQDTDVVIFGGGPARIVSVAYEPVGGASAVTITFGDHAVTFGVGLFNAAANNNLHFDDGSSLQVGGPGIDNLSGRAGNDALFGGQGNDTLFGRSGDNVVQGNQGDDAIRTDQGADIIFGGQGNDVIFTGIGGTATNDKDDFAQGNLGNDTIHGGNGWDILLGGQGDDSIDGAGGVDILKGNLGNDVLVTHGASRLSGEDGTDTLSAQAPGAILSGGTGADLFIFSPLSGLASPTVDGSSITDWETGDHLHFEGQLTGGTGANYVEATASDYNDARDVAGGFMATGEIQTVAVQVGDSVVVFANTGPAPGPEVSALLAGRALSDIDFGNIV